MCVLEIKTLGAENTTALLIQSVLVYGKWTECESGTDDFETAIPNPGYRTQVAQHATALALNHVMVVYCLPGALVKKIALITIPDEHRTRLFDFQCKLARKYMPFAYDLEAASREIPSLGADYSKAYRYAQDHHTLELNLLIWFAHTKDVLANGTPSDCCRFIDLPTCFWNKLMGNVDIVRKMLKKDGIARMGQ